MAKRQWPIRFRENLRSVGSRRAKPGESPDKPIKSVASVLGMLKCGLLVLWGLFFGLP